MVFSPSALAASSRHGEQPLIFWILDDSASESVPKSRISVNVNPRSRWHFRSARDRLMARAVRLRYCVAQRLPWAPSCDAHHSRLGFPGIVGRAAGAHERVGADSVHMPRLLAGL